MRRMRLRILLVVSFVSLAAAAPMSTSPRAAETNPVRRHSAAIVTGMQTSRLIVGLRAAQSVPALAHRAGLAMAGSRQFGPGMHVIFLQGPLYGAAVQTALAKLRADPAVKYADIDQRRYPHSQLPDDPLFQPQPGVASGQWYMLTPSPASVLVEGIPTVDLSATDAISAWSITTGGSIGTASPGAATTVIADIDTGVRFDHPDLLRAGRGGRLLPGYDFVSQDYDPTSGAALGTFLRANDGDGWDPDPSDPGDWINSADQANAAFPAASCPVGDSSWHGTRVSGILGALTNNEAGIAGMTWSSWILPVRALGKCGGYDSDIIAGMEWAAGISIPGVPDNPYPANIINLSLGDSGACPTDYQDAITQILQKNVLIVASAGNGGATVDAPANCPGVLAVAGLRNVGTKVGYSSFGSEVGISAPAGNCVTTSGDCLRAIDTTTNSGLTTPSTNSYTNEINPNLGTSFSAPIVSGVAALMRSVNGNLSPAQLIARLQAGAVAFPAASGSTPVCSAATSNVECSCTTATCGAGMVNALNAVVAAQRPIAAVVVPTLATGSNALFDGSGSAAACGRTLASYAWTASAGINVVSGANLSQVTIVAPASSGTLTLTVTDNTGATDTAVIDLSATDATTSAPAGAGTQACPATVSATPTPPTVSQSFSPSSVGVSAASVLTITLSNPNGFALTSAGFTDTLPAQLLIASSPAPTTTCTGSGDLTTTTSTITLSDAIIPANGSCTVTVSASSSTAASYTNSLAASALMTASAGGNTQPVSSTLTVTAPSKSGGGGAVDGWDMMFVIGVLLAGRRHAGRRRR